MDYCYGKNPFNFGAGSIQNESLAALWDFRYNIL